MCSAMAFMKSGDTLFPTQAHPALIPGPRHHSDVKPGVVAVIRSLGRAGCYMVPATRKPGRIVAELQCKIAPHSD